VEFFHGAMEYDSNHRFSREELLELRPSDIKRWMVDHTYGDPNYNVKRGDQPLYWRLSTAEFAKKSISYFMPNRLPRWVNGAGNPTKSTAVNDFVKEIKKV
jgi:hypothetical protein